MSEVTDTDLAWSPPPFPAQGRLPSQTLLVGQHCHQQNSSERNYRQELCMAAGQRVEPPCCKSLHIRLSLTALAITSMPIPVGLNHH